MEDPALQRILTVRGASSAVFVLSIIYIWIPLRRELGHRDGRSLAQEFGGEDGEIRCKP
jgi:hypothetical protein